MEIGEASAGSILARAEVPVIEFGKFRKGSRRERACVAAEIGKESKECGFFFVSGHGISEVTMTGAFSAAKDFFLCSQNEKMEVAIGADPPLGGWYDFGFHGNLREGYRIELPYGDLEMEAQKTEAFNQWPARPPEFERAMVEYGGSVRNLARQILEAIAIALDLNDTYFQRYFTHGTSLLQPLHYPPQHGIEGQMVGIEAHTDFGALTLLAQDDTTGLQVLGRDSIWLDASPIPGTLVVNIGDLMARWSNGILTSAMHRVVNTSSSERYSIPYFCDPNPEAIIDCLPTCVSACNPAKYSPITASEYIQGRIARISE